MRGPGWALACLALSACALGPPRAPEGPGPALAPAPSRWSTSTPPAATAASSPSAVAAVDPERWWSAFEDPELRGWIEAALANNPDLTGIQARLAQSRASARQAGAASWPTLDASASAQRSRQRGVTGTSYQADLSVSWEPDVFGGLSASTRAAQADVRAQAAQLAQARLSLVAEVASNHLARRRDMQRAALARTILDSQLRTQQITRWRREAGLASGLDVDQGESAVAQTRAGIPALEANVQVLGHALELLAGRAPGTTPTSAPQAAVDDIPDGQVATFEGLPGRIPAQALEARPDVQAALATYQAAAARIDAARAARWPSFRLGASTGLEMLAWGGSASLARSMLASLALPIFDAGAREAQVDARVAAWQEAGAQLQATVLTALQEVEDALVSWRAARERQQALVTGVDAAVRAATLARTRYQAGLVDLRTVLDTQRSELGLRDALQVARTDDVLAQVRLVKALAGGWVPRTALPAPTNSR